jgi:hypothetical protein
MTGDLAGLMDGDVKGVSSADFIAGVRKRI